MAILAFVLEELFVCGIADGGSGDLLDSEAKGWR